MRRTLFLAIVALSLTCIIISPPVWAVPNLISYQGKLTDPNGLALNGDKEIGLFLYNAETGGSPVWNESQTVSIVNGIYNIQLGAVIPLGTGLFNEDVLYLEVRIGDEILSPRQRITSTAYAMRAGDALTLDGTGVNELEESEEIGIKIEEHKTIPNTHHTKTTSFKEMIDMATDAQIPNDITIDSFKIRGYTKAALPTSGIAGHLVRVTDNVRGLWMDQGDQWFPLNGSVVNVMEFGAIGNGIMDDSNAFNEALATGKRILVPNGFIFRIGNVIVFNQTLLGGGTIKKKKDSPWALHITGDGAVINGLRFEAEYTSGQPNADIRLGNGGRNIRIINCSFESSTYSAVAAASEGDPEYSSHVSGVLFLDNIVKGGYARPLYLYSIDNITIKGNIIRDCRFDAIRLRDNNGFCLIEGNQFINIGNPSWPDEQTRDAVDCYWSGNHLTISNNIIDTVASCGMDIKGYAPDGSHGSRKVIVSNNQIYRARYSGIVIAGDADYDGNGSFKSLDGIIVTGNIIEECNQNNRYGGGSIGAGAIHCRRLCSYSTIVNNYVASNYARGIYINNDAPNTEISKSIRVSGNICINNGQVDSDSGIGIIAYPVDGLIVTDNICENDQNLPNPYQKIGIKICSESNGYSTTKSISVRNNICRNNLSYQIITENNGSRADAIAVFEGNIQKGPGAIQRATWHDQRSIFFGTGVPGIGDGTFRQGDLIFNVNAVAGGSVGWICIVSGKPGIWKEFGKIED